MLDNSVVIRWLLRDGSNADLAYATAVNRALINSSCTAPSIWTLELTNVIVRAERRNDLARADADEFLNIVKALEIVIDDETSSRMIETLAIARQFGTTAYDAAYLELARRRNLPLATLDRDLLRAAKRAGVRRYEP
ncbi:MAG TPA: type II toxin-antitoxin system VapC family toxin [Pyrinomonadaceae bacterium]